MRTSATEHGWSWESPAAFGCDARAPLGTNFRKQKSASRTTPTACFRPPVAEAANLRTTNGQCRVCDRALKPLLLSTSFPVAKSAALLLPEADRLRLTTLSAAPRRVGNQECVNSDKTKPVCDSGFRGKCRARVSRRGARPEALSPAPVVGASRARPIPTACLVDTNFPPATRLSGPTPVCRGCMVDADCDTLLCDTVSKILVSKAKSVAAFPKGAIAWVEQQPELRDDGRSGSDTKPFCTADAAYNSGASTCT